MVASTYHSLCMKEAIRTKQPIPIALTDSWWAVEAPEVLVNAFADRQDGFDAVVVDEGQDFSPLWLDSLRLIMRQEKQSPFFVFADSRQDIWKRQWRENAEFAFSWELTLNLRNTEPIARKVAEIIGVDCVPTGMSGRNHVGESLPPRASARATYSTPCKS